MAIIHQRGAILLIAQVTDPQGQNTKDRPVVLIQDFADTDALAYGVAITGAFEKPLPESVISLPFHRGGKCRTGLTKESVAVCTWRVGIDPSSILKRIGITPPRELLRILEQIQGNEPV